MFRKWLKVRFFGRVAFQTICVSDKHGLSETQIRKRSEIAFQTNHVRVCLKRKSGIFANCVSDKPHVGKGLILLWLISWRRHREIFSMVCLKRNLRILPKSRFRQTTQSSQYWLKKFPTCFHHALPGWLECAPSWWAMFGSCRWSLKNYDSPPRGGVNMEWRTVDH